MENRKLMSTVQTDIEQLQMKLAFQEDTIESLNQALIQQQKQMDDLQFQHLWNCLHLRNKLL